MIISETTIGIEKYETILIPPIENNHAKDENIPLKLQYIQDNHLFTLHTMSIKTFSALLMIIGVCIQPLFASFHDSMDHMYASAITQLSEAGIVGGYKDGTFRPDQSITRAEMLKIIMRAAEIPLQENNSNCFRDVKNKDRFADYVCTAKTHEIIQWYEDGSFRPNTTVTIAEGLKIALKGFGIRTESTTGEWYQEYLDFVHKNGIFSQYSIYPHKGMTRGMMAHLTASIINNTGKQRTGSRNNKSSWCQAPHPTATPTSLLIHGQERSLIADIGAGYQHGTPTQLIIAFHGRTNSNAQVRQYLKLDKNFWSNSIIVYPSGLPEEGPTRNWMNPGEKATALRDYAFFDEIVKEFSSRYCINMDEIYVVGHSLGAWFTNNLGCARGHIIRGIGSVGGSMTIWAQHCTGPVDAIIMHHPKDNLASFAGGEQARDTILKQNQCDTSKTESVWPDRGFCQKYTACASGARVVWCPHEDSDAYPHMRPSFASAEISKFFHEK